MSETIYRLTLNELCYRKGIIEGDQPVCACPGVIGPETGEIVDPNDPVAVAEAARREQKRIAEAKLRCETQIAMGYLCQTNSAEKGILVNTGGDNGYFLPGFSIFAVAGKKLVPPPAERSFDAENIWSFGTGDRVSKAIPIIQKTLKDLAVFVDKITKAKIDYETNKQKCNNAFIINLVQRKSKKIGEI